MRPASLPESAINAGAEALQRHAHAGKADPWRERAIVVLEAAAPALAEELLRPLFERHARVDGEWGPSCGTCWVKGNSRAAWPCSEVIAVSVLLPVPHAPASS